MNFSRHIGILVFAAAAAVSALALSPERRGAVNGEVSLVQADGPGSLKDGSRIVVWLAPVDMVQQVRVTEKRYRLLQHNKRFEPGLLVVPVGSVVDFPK